MNKNHHFNHANSISKTLHLIKPFI